jgi:hypothetical protein
LIEDISDSASHPAPTTRFSIDLKSAASEEKSVEGGAEKAFMIFTNGTTLMRMDNLNDYAMLVDPTIVPFMLPDEKNITGILGSAIISCLQRLCDLENTRNSLECLVTFNGDFEL